jgi:peroxiredoxin
VRDWDGRSAEIEAVGAALYILTSDSPEVLDEAVPKHGLTSAIVPVDRGLWGRWGIANPKRKNLPWPSTVVVAGDGTILDLVTHENHRERADPEAVLGRLNDR